MKLVIEKSNDLKNAEKFGITDLLEETNVLETDGMESEEDIGETYISENNDEYRLEIFVPGFRREDFIVQVTEDGLLSIKAKSGSEYYQIVDSDVEEQELTEYEFYKSFTLPAHADEQDIEAYYEDGILTVLIPKN